MSRAARAYSGDLWIVIGFLIGQRGSVYLTDDVPWRRQEADRYRIEAIVAWPVMLKDHSALLAGVGPDNFGEPGLTGASQPDLFAKV